MKKLVCSFVVAGSMLAVAHAQQASTQPPAPRTILAIGAHPGDMEVTCGALLAKQAKRGDRVVLVHLTAGEGGNPRVNSEEYGEQKKREARAAAQVIGAEVIFGSFADGQLANTDQTRHFVVGVIRQVKPAYVITHWKNGLHKDHIAAHFITSDAVLLASLEGYKADSPPHRGIRGIYYTENWEDKADFSPYVYVDVSDALDLWEQCVKQYELIRGGISSFPYFEYYQSLARLRGAESGFKAAVAFDIDSWSKKRILSQLP
ncbi:MAG: PIG-L family deacetylase [Acidobacteria bacterium]|nr:MAG: PIG-L family deacetylase [Acidobacteriota bacterium]